MSLIALLLGIAGILGLVLGLYLGLAWLLSVLYAAIAPAFGWPELTYWQVFAAMMILSIVGGFFKSTASSKTRA